jgi:hypothetical protein
MNVKKEGELMILTHMCDSVLADPLFRDILGARTFSQFQAVIHDAAPDNPYENTLHVRSLAPPTLQ